MVEKQMAEMVTNGDIQGVLKVFQEGFKPKLFHKNIHKLHRPVSIISIIIILDVKKDFYNFPVVCFENANSCFFAILCMIQKCSDVTTAPLTFI